MDQTDYSSRNRAKSDKPFESLYASSLPKNSFKIAGKMVLQHNFTSRIPEGITDQDQNSLQNMKSSVLTSKTTKLSQFVHLPKLRFQQTCSPPPMVDSQEAIERKPPLLKTINNPVPPVLFEEDQHSVLMETHSKLSESAKLPEEDAWNIQKLQMALDYIQLEETDSPMLNRHTAKRRMRKEKEKENEKGEKERQVQGEKQKQMQRQRERVRRERQRNMEMVSGFLSGKATFMWLFILSDTQDEAMSPVREIYKSYIDNDYEVPICKNYNDAIRFLKIESCFFKIVSDLPNSELLIKETEHNKNIIAIYIYNPEREKGVARAFQIKRNSRKVRGMFMDLADAAQLAQEEIQNQAKFIKVGNQLERERNRLRFPSFFILSGADSTDVTSYRMCLYGSLCLKEPKQRQLYLKEFTDMVEIRYANSQAQMRNLEDYKKIDHLSIMGEQKHRQILSFYVRESFYYALVNSMLRLSRNPEEFRPCAIPFNETYLAIKHFYKQHLLQNSKKLIKFRAYRGAKLRNSDVKALQVGSLIQLLGFTSTSLKLEQARKFMDNDSYLIEIVVEVEARSEQELDYDHGFIDINRYKLATTSFQAEEEVLFNALNVYRVASLDLESAVRKITLSYGAVVSLMRSKRADPTEISVLENYRHCVSQFKLIQDDGDALRLAQEHHQCVSYYQAKIQSGDGNASSFGKLAGAQLQVGDLDAAYQNAVRSLALIEQEGKKAPLNTALTIPLEMDSRVFEESQDVVNYQRSTDLRLQLLEGWEEKCNLLCSRAQKKLHVGNYKGCIADLKQAQNTINSHEKSFDKRRGEIKRKYLFTAFCCLCSSKQAQLEEQRQIELLKIEQDQILFESKRSVKQKISLEIQIGMKEVSLKIGDQNQYRKSLARAQQHYQQLASSSASPTSSYQLAQMQLMQAHTLDINHHFPQYQDLVEEAIENIRVDHPLHPDIAKYSQLLGLKRYEAIQQNLNIPSSTDLKKFDYEHHKLMYKKCRSALLQAGEQLSFLKGATHPRTLAVHNQLATLDYDFSLLKQAEDRMRIGSKLESGSEGAKCHILLAKIALAKGELKRASLHIQKATVALKGAVLKQSRPEYDAVLLRHPLYLEISILRAKVYNRQQKHELALKELQMLQRLVKLQKPYNLALLANLQQEQAEILVCLGETQHFESCVLRSVRLRQQAMGKFNIPNAISFSNLFKYLRFTSDFENSVKYHQKSTEIFSRFPPDHPNAWVLHLSNGLIFFQRRQFQLALPQLETGLRIAERRYSPAHINFMKIRLQFAKLLKSMGHLERALNILESLQTIISKNIKESALTYPIEQETDDQKITVKKSILLEMKELYERSRNEQNIARNMLALERCQVSLRECQEFVSDEKIDSLKSLT